MNTMICKHFNFIFCSSHHSYLSRIFLNLIMVRLKSLNNFNLDQKLLSKNASKLSLVTYKSKKLIVSVFKFLCIETCQELFSKTGKMCAVSLNNIVQSKTISKWNSNVLSKNLESSMTSFRCLWVIWEINYALAEISVSLKE